MLLRGRWTSSLIYARRQLFVTTALLHSSSATTQLVMPPKRKRNSSQPASPHPESNGGGGGRRTSRRIKDMAETESSPLDTNSGNRAAPARNPRRTGEGAWTSKEGVERAMRDLSQMETKLQNAVKRQRLAIENSDLSLSPENTIETKLRAHQSKSDRQVINDKPQDEPNEIEKAPLDDYEAELAQGDVVKAKGEADTSDKSARRPPPINSGTLPLPWKGRLGYACLNTYLRTSNPPVFSSRTCRISSIIEHRHPLQDPSQPEHATKNRPDKNKPANIKLGQKYVEELGLANARDIPKMIRWNDKYGIKFMRLSSEMFPFASHDEYGYKLAPFAAKTLAEAGKVVAELRHRVTTHPGQFTQIGSPRKEVVKAAIRDLDYHDELLSLLKLPEQMDRDAVMILHMGGTYGDKAATLDRFRQNYATLSQGVKNRLVLENDDVSWSVHDLLPVCEELNIPMVLDYHHHNIIFDDSIREGSLDIISLYDRIKKTWTRKRITQKMHYSESTASAVTPRERRKHSARVKTLPPCAVDMDLMIEAKDKEQAVFELMRTFKLPGWDLFNNIVPHERDDESKKAIKKKKSAMKKSKKAKTEDEDGQSQNGVDDDIEVPEKIVSADDFGMGGPENRVYWPEGMEEWLRPRKRETAAKSTPKKNGNGAANGEDSC